MSKPICQDCGLRFHGGVRCSDSKKDAQKACERFAAGRPLRPYYKGRPIKEVEFDEEEDHAWSFWTADNQVLLVFWEVDTNGYGSFRMQQIGLDHDGVVTQRFLKDAPPQPAFHGEVIVRGAGDNSLYSSAGYEDADQLDFEGNVTNKPGSIQILPARKEG